jgi:hypothetical protein
MSAPCQKLTCITSRFDGRRSEDYLLFPAYTNRETASRIVQRQFNEALERAKDVLTAR